MIFLFENFAESRLEGGALPTDSVLSIPAQDAGKFPQPNSPQQRFAVILYDGIQDPEVCWASSNSGSGNLVVERGQEDTAPKHWRPGTAVINAPTKVSLNYLSSGGSDSWHQELLDMINDAYARITVTNELLLTETGALATRIESVEAGWADNNAQVTTLAQAFAGISEAWATYQVEVSAQTSDAVAKATQAMNTATSAEQAVAELETQIEAAIGDDAAAFAEKIQALVNFDEAQVQINQDASARFDENEANFNAEVLLRATQFDAQTLVNQSHDSRIAGNTGRIETEELTRAGETAALAQRSSNLEAEVTAGRGGAANLAARINGVESVAASQTSAVATRTSTLEGQMAGTSGSGLRARIESEEQARVSADSAQATRTNNLEVSYLTNVRPTRLETDGSNFTTNANGTAAVGSLPAARVENVAGFGLVGIAADGATIYHRGPVSFQTNRIYQVRIRVEVVAATAQNVRIFIRGMKDDYVTTAASNTSAFVSVAPGVVTDITALYGNPAPSGGLLLGGDTAWTRAGIQSQGPISGGYLRTYEIYHEDVTDISTVGARVTTEETARIAGDTALANQIITVESVTRVNPNLIPNSTFSDMGAYWTVPGTWLYSTPTAPTGPHIINPNNGTSQISTADYLQVNQTLTYTLSADVRRLATSGNAVLDVEWYNASNGLINRSARIVVSTNQNFSEQPRKSVTVVPPAGATKAKIRAFSENIAGISQNGVAFRQIKFEASTYPTLWTDDRTNQLMAANVTQTMQTIANAGNLDAWWQVQAIAGSALAGIRAKANSVGGSQLAMIADAIALFNTVMGQAEEVLVAQGGNVYIRKKLILGPLGELEFDPSYPAIFWKIGTATLAIGKLPQNNLLFWFGPTQTPANMRKNNATIWFDTPGAAYWGGQIFAGTLSNSITGTTNNVPVSVTLGPFSTNGGPKVIVWSYEYNRAGFRYGNQTPTGTTTALVRLYQKIGTGAETLVDSMTVTGTINYAYDAEPIPGQPVGTTGKTDFVEYMGNTKSYTDSVAGTAQRTYRVEVVSRSIRSIGGTGPADDASQRYAATSSE